MEKAFISIEIDAIRAKRDSMPDKSDLRLVITPELWDAILTEHYGRPSDFMRPNSYLGMKVIETPLVEGWFIMTFEELRQQASTAIKLEL